MLNYVLYTLTVLIWGSTWLAIHLQLTQVEPVLSVGYRFGLAALVLFLICLGGGMGLRFSLRDHLYMAGQGVTLFGASYWFLYLASEHLTSGLLAVVFSTILMMNILNLRLFLGRPVQRPVIAAGVLGLTGICLVFWTELLAFEAGSGWLGILMGIAATYLASVGNIIAVRNARLSIPVTQANAFGMAYGAVFILLVGLAQVGEFQFCWSLDYLLPLLYLSIIGSVLAFGCYIALVGRIGADRAAYALILSPILALVLSTLFEGYIWTWSAVFGGVSGAVGQRHCPEPGREAERASQPWKIVERIDEELPSWAGLAVRVWGGPDGIRAGFSLYALEDNLIRSEARDGAL